MIVRVVPVILLVILSGCDRPPEPKTKKPSPITVNLRVVMLVEPGADLDNPPSRTGGCKLTRTQVIALVDDLKVYANNAIPGLRFVWNPADLVRLEASCMAVQPPILGPCVSPCSGTALPANCPRSARIDWFSEHVLNQCPGTEAGLQQCDDWEIDPCTLNIYFVGNFKNASGSAINGTTGHGSVLGGSVRPLYVVINDRAFEDPAAPAVFSDIKDVDRTVLHEAVCHWLGNVMTHVEPSPGNQWPRDLCISGLTFCECFDVYNQIKPTEITRALQGENRAYLDLQGCGGGP